MTTRWVPAPTFADFAELDLVRWRALVGRAVTARDARWGSGRVVDVRWEGRSDRPDDAGRIYVRVEYTEDLRVRVDARAFARLHLDVEVREDVAEFLTRWARDDRDAARAALHVEMAALDESLRREQDAERGRRVRELKERSRHVPGA